MNRSQINRWVGRTLLGLLACHLEALASCFVVESRAPRDDPFSRGCEDNEKKWYAEAVEDFTEALRTDPDDSIYILSSRAAAYDGEDDFAAAIADSEHALQIDPTFAGGYTNLGWSYWAMGQWDQALAAYEKARQLNPNDTLASYNMGEVNIECENWDQAITNLSENIHPTYHSVPVPPNYIEVPLEGIFPNYLRGVAYFHKGDFDDALSDFAASFTSDPRQSAPRIAYGVALQAKGLHVQAIASFNAAIALNSSIPDAYCDRAISEAETGDIPSALRDFKEAIWLRPNFGLALQNRGNLYLKLHQYDEALEDLSAAISIFVRCQDDPPQLSDREYTNYKAGTCDLTLADSSASVRRDAPLVNAYTARGDVYLQQGFYARAGADFARALRLNPDDKKAQSGLALTRQAINR